MIIKLTEIEYDDTGCPTCGTYGGDYGYEEPPDELILEVDQATERPKFIRWLLNPLGKDVEADFPTLSSLADLPHEIGDCKIETLN